MPVRQLALPDISIQRQRYGDSQKRYEQLVRCLRLMQRIEGREFCPPLRSLAAELEVHPRTVRRYLDAMSCAGVAVPPLFTEYEKGGAL